MTEAASTNEPDPRDPDDRRLRVFLGDTGAFRLALATYGNPADRDRIIARLREDLTDQGIETLTLDIEATGDETSLLNAATQTVDASGVPPSNAVLMVVNAESRMDFQRGGTRAQSVPLFETANMHRDLFATSVPMPVVLWLSPMAHRIFAREAPDLWHWRTGSFDFVREPSARMAWLEDQRPSDSFMLDLPGRDELNQRLANLTELWEWLDESAPDTDSGATRAQKLDVLVQIARTREELRDYHGALENYDAAEKLFEPQMETGAVSLSGISQWAVIAHGKSNALRLVGHVYDGIDEICEKIPVLTSYTKIYPEDSDLQLLLATFIESAAQWIAKHQGHSESLNYYDRALEHLRQATHLAPNTKDNQRKLADVLQVRAQVATRLGENDDAAKFLEEAIELRRTLASNNYATTADHWALKYAIEKLAEVQLGLERLEEAEALAAEAVAIARRISDRTGRGSSELAVALSTFAGVQERKGDLASAESALMESIQHVQTALETLGKQLPLLGLLANLEEQLYEIRFAQGDMDRAASALEDAKHDANKAAELAPEDTMVQRELANISRLEAQLHAAQENAGT